MSRGEILLVGLGPGAADQMSGRARQAIAHAEVVIGYTKYLDLVEDLLDGKEVIRKAMTQEVDRCVAAWERAREGRRVALVSSGDIGVYGMAGLTYEVLFRSGWVPDEDIRVEVIPGITALSASASLVGAPLSHDFCAISLSDLLTPWPVIARRLESAARGDFVVALYNPRSGRRQGQLLEAHAILLRHRRPNTPVAIVDAAYRERQAKQLTTLEEMLSRRIGMLSTVLIGSSTTYQRAGLMITPRGYGGKYQDLTGKAKVGEKSGRSLTMGLEGWKACVRGHLRDSVSSSLLDAARHFDAPLDEILSAVSEVGDGEDMDGYAAAAVVAGREAETLTEARGWGRIRIVMDARTGSTCELLLDGRDIAFDSAHVRVQREGYRLEVDWSRMRRGWFVRRGDYMRGLQFVDVDGNALFAFYLAREGVAIAAGARMLYEQAWARLSVARPGE